MIKQFVDQNAKVLPKRLVCFLNIGALKLLVDIWIGNTNKTTFKGVQVLILPGFNNP
ncbi:hypothetical protein ACSS6N_18505 [Peribacillus frigoritolerans]|uniref:hypothetical protein n=1 Tax=Peribacillus frigoritolerans TaxID=450367 RepID=UPI003D04A194